MKIGIVGAGIVGRLLAWHLCQRFDVHLFSLEAVDAQSTTSIMAAGMISPIAELPLLPKGWYQIALRALYWWPKILESLTMPVGYRQQGSLMIALPCDRS